MKSPIKRYIRNYPYFKVILYKGIFLEVSNLLNNRLEIKKKKTFLKILSRSDG